MFSLTSLKVPDCIFINDDCKQKTVATKVALKYNRSFLTIFNKIQNILLNYVVFFSKHRFKLLLFNNQKLVLELFSVNLFKVLFYEDGWT